MYDKAQSGGFGIFELGEGTRSSAMGFMGISIAEVNDNKRALYTVSR